LLREPSVVLIDRDADALFDLSDSRELPAPARETVN